MLCTIFYLFIQTQEKGDLLIYKYHYTVQSLHIKSDYLLQYRMLFVWSSFPTPDSMD